MLGYLTNSLKSFSGVVMQWQIVFKAGTWYFRMSIIIQTSCPVVVTLPPMVSSGRAQSVFVYLFNVELIYALN